MSRVDLLDFLLFHVSWGFDTVIIHTLVKATIFETVCHFRTQVSAIATQFLQTFFSTVHYLILPCQIPFIFSISERCRNSSIDYYSLFN